MVPRAWEAHADEVVARCATGYRLVPSAAVRVRLGCVFEPQPAETFGLLVMRMRPRRGVVAVVHDAWEDLAPSLSLLSGRTSGLARGGPDRCRGARLHLGWEEFARAYRAELEALPPRVHLELVWQIGTWLRFHRSVSILSHERVGDGDELGGHTQRRILREWLLGLQSQLSQASQVREE
jgi:hypothetical protein